MKRIRFPVELFPLPRRVVSVPGWEEVEVCSHIVRIDIDKDGSYGTHGWQVRYEGQTRLFSDTLKHPGRTDLGNPWDSLREAARYLAEVYRGPQLIQAPAERVNKEIKLDRPGIRLVLERKSHKTFDELYVEAEPPERGLVPRRFYVGTENTVSKKKLQEKIQEAEAMRKDWVAQVRAQRSINYLYELQKRNPDAARRKRELLGM